MASISLSLALARVLADREKTAQIHTNPKTFFVHVRVPDHVAAQLSEVQRRIIPDTEKHQEIDHVTLVYTKKALEDHPPEKVHAALEALRRVGERTEPIQAKIQGWGYFDGAQKDGKTTTALVALLDAPGLEHLHVDMSRALKSHGVEPSDSHIFTPHITLGYLGAGERADKHLEPLAGRFTIDKAHVASNDLHEIPLTGHENVGLKAAMLAAKLATMSPATNFTMSTSALRQDHRAAPGKGQTSPSIGAAPTQTGAMHSGGGLK